MLKFLRKNTKIILISVASVFVVTMLYGIGRIGFQENFFNRFSQKTHLAKVNGKEVDIFRYNQILGGLMSEQKEILDPSKILDLQYTALSRLIDFTIIYQAASKSFSANSAEIEYALDQIMKTNKIPNKQTLERALKEQGFSLEHLKRMIKEDIIVNKMANKINSQISITPDDLREVRVQHILFKTLDKPKSEEKKIKKLAEEVLAKAKSGQDFSELARKYSEDLSSAQNGGDLGFFGTGVMVKEFEKAAFSLKPGEISDIVKTTYGYHIIKMLESKPKIVADKNKLLEDKRKAVFDEWFIQQRQKARIEILNPMLAAYDNLQKGDYKTAEEKFKIVAKNEPSNPYPHYFLGKLFVLKGDLPAAAAEYDKAVSLSSADPVLTLYIGDAYLSLSNMVSKESSEVYKDAAIKEFNRASALAADNVLMRKFLADYFDKNNLRELKLQEQNKIAQIERKKKLEEELKKQ